MLSSDKHSSAGNKLTEELVAPRCLINQTLNKLLRVANRAEQPKHGTNQQSILLREGGHWMSRAIAGLKGSRSGK